MASLTNTKIKDTYDGLLKTTDNDALGGTYKLITDGLGNSSGLYLGTGGRLGIGTSSPLSILDLGSNSNTSQEISISGGRSTYGYDASKGASGAVVIQGSANKEIHFETTADSADMVVDSSGRLGVGTSSPDFKTHLYDSGNTVLGITAGTANYASLQFGSTSDTTRGGIEYYTGDDSLRLKTGNNTERMRIDSSGNLTLDPNGNGAAYLKLNTLSGASGDGHIILQRGGTNKFQIAANNSNALTFYNYTAGGTSMTIDSSGNLGIGGTADSDYRIHLYKSTNSEMAFESTGTNGGFYRIGTGHDASGFGGAFRIYDMNASAERMRIDSSGRVGLGTTSPSFPLHVVTDSGTYEVLTIQNGSSAALFRAIGSGGGSVDFGAQVGTANTAIIRTGSTERLRIDSSGNVGINCTPSGSKFQVNQSADQQGISLGMSSRGSSRILWEMSGSTNEAHTFLHHNGTDRYSMWSSSRDSHSFYTGNTERMRITSGGEFGFGTSSDNVVNGSVYIKAVGSTNTVIKAGHKTGSVSGADFLACYYNNVQIGGVAQSGTTGVAFNTTSDYRLKENVVDMVGALDRVDQLEPKRFNFIADEDTTVDGFLAHEVQDIVPEAVTGEKDATEEYEVSPEVLDDEGNVVEEAVMGTRDVYQGIDQSKLVPLLVGAIKELKAEIETLKSQINS